MHDPLKLQLDPVFVPAGLLPVLELFDGRKSVDEIAAALSRRFAEEVPPALIEKIAGDLDGHLCLMGERFERALRELRQGFAARPHRDPSHAGSAGYPADPALLAMELDRILAEGSGREPGALRALIAPHIDIARGRKSYAETYRTVAAAPRPDLFVILGTAHAGPSTLLVPTKKDYLTPLGPAVTDAEFVDSVAARLGPGAYDEEFLHQHEHSIEFQALFLRHLFGDELRIAPFLTGHLGDGGAGPGAAAVEQAVAALADAAASSGKTVCFVAAADLAHVGPHFGDPNSLGETGLARLRELDLASLALCAAGDAEGWSRSVQDDGNSRRICGLSPIYLAIRCAGSRAGVLLHYEQSTSESGDLCVTHAGMAFPG
jgi:hypothetical protein